MAKTDKLKTGRKMRQNRHKMIEKMAVKCRKMKKKTCKKYRKIHERTKLKFPWLNLIFRFFDNFSKKVEIYHDTGKSWKGFPDKKKVWQPLRWRID